MLINQLRAKIGKAEKQDAQDRLQIAFTKSNATVKTPTIDPAIVQGVVLIAQNLMEDKSISRTTMSNKIAKDVLSECVAHYLTTVLKRDLPDPDNPEDAKVMKPTKSVAGPKA